MARSLKKGPYVEPSLGKKIEARFNELGFGSTHGYITLPHLS